MKFNYNKVLLVSSICCLLLLFGLLTKELYYKNIQASNSAFRIIVKSVDVLTPGLNIASIINSDINSEPLAIWNEKRGACIVSPSQPGFSSNDQINECYSIVYSHINYGQNVNILLKDGTYNLSSSLFVIDNMTLSSLSGDPKKVIINRATQNIGPLILMQGISGGSISNITVDGQLMYPQTQNAFNNTNVFIDNCYTCSIKNIISQHSRFSSININSGTNITVENNYVANNGTPEDMTGIPFLRSDGITVHAIKGTSSVSSNIFENNTDIDLVIGRGSTGILKIHNNKVLTSRLSKIGNQPIVGAGIFFDTIPTWSSQCIPNMYTGTGDCSNEFRAVDFKNNVNECGANCIYGIGAGTRMNNNWNYEHSNGSTSRALSVKYLVIDQSNKTDRLTINSGDEGSLINPQTNFCKYSVDSISGTYNNSVCTPCRGALYQGTSVPSDGSVCDIGEDAGYSL